MVSDNRGVALQHKVSLFASRSLSSVTERRGGSSDKAGALMAPGTHPGAKRK